MKNLWGKLLGMGLGLLVLTQQSHSQVAFALTGNYPMAKAYVSITPVEINADGKIDLIVANGRVLILTNDGNGGFATNATLAATGNGPVTVADINGDSQVDLIWSDSGFAGHLIIFTNNGSGSFVTNAAYSVGNTPGSPVVLDVNNDGKLDLVCPNQADKTLSVLTNNGSGSFQLASSPATGSEGGPVNLLAVDINNNGKLALVCANNGVVSAGHTLSILTNNGTGIFKLAATPNVGTQPGSVVANEINADGRIDLICGNVADKTLSILTNNGSGGFGSNATLEVGFRPGRVIAADINLDGKVDLICANISTNTLMVFTNNGGGIFGSNTIFRAGFHPAEVAAADINGDGNLDLICGDNGLYSDVTRGGLLIFANVPTLTSQYSNGNLVMSWPTAWTNWTLIQSSDLTAGWTEYGGPISNSGSNTFVTNATPSGYMFFRLRYP